MRFFDWLFGRSKFNTSAKAAMKMQRMQIQEKIADGFSFSEFDVLDAALKQIEDQAAIEAFGTTKTDGFSRYIHNPERRKDWLRITGDEPPLKPHFVYNWRRGVFIEYIAPSKRGVSNG